MSEVLSKLEIALIKLEIIEENLVKRHKKMMEGFRCVEKSFQTLAGAIISLSEDMSDALGTMATDPWEL
jgi:hypothetical protein